MKKKRKATLEVAGPKTKATRQIIQELAGSSVTDDEQERTRGQGTKHSMSHQMQFSQDTHADPFSAGQALGPSGSRDAQVRSSVQMPEDLEVMKLLTQVAVTLKWDYEEQMLWYAAQVVPD